MRMSREMNSVLPTHKDVPKISRLDEHGNITNNLGECIPLLLQLILWLSFLHQSQVGPYGYIQIQRQFVCSFLQPEKEKEKEYDTPSIPLIKCVGGGGGILS
jgi:hypothetical protein